MTGAQTAVRAPEDAVLASRCASGDPSAQRQLFDDYRTHVHRTLYRILGSNREMEDLVQESFLEVFRSVGSFRGESKLSTWISRISARVAFAYIGRRRPPELALEQAPAVGSGAPSAERRVIAREAMAHLYDALDRIDPKQRIAFALHVIDGRSLREVAEITDASLVATKTRVWRARRDLWRRAGKDPLLAEFLRDKETGQ